jgi:hypothetical protein
MAMAAALTTERGRSGQTLILAITKSPSMQNGHPAAAKVVSPQHMVGILTELDKPETKLEWALALVHGATALRPEECFR